MPINPLKSLFSRKSTSDGASEKLSATSPRYAYAFPSPYKQPRILILVDNVRATYFLFFHYVLLRLHNTESLAFFVLDSAEVGQWTKGKTPEAFVDQVIADAQPTLVIFSRYGAPYGDVLPALFKAKNVATVYHVDDDLLNIDPALGEEIQQRQGDPVVLSARKILLAQTDLIYASTAALGDRLASQFPQQTVFNARCTPYLDFLISSEPDCTKALTFGYMGSKGHQADLNAIAPQIAHILTDYPQVRFETFGTIKMPEALKAFSKQTQAYDTEPDYAKFLNQLRQLNWAIGLAPLQNTKFNQCKTASKYVEYTACGIATIVSDGLVYAQFTPEEQTLTAAPDQWFNKIQQLIEDETLRNTLVANSQAHCAATFSLEAVEAQIKELLALA
ncbi:MAG: hypothetical protein DCF25_08870 [Leptolyngbya foveolarum]|uniref:Spore protein YkvP/CgeB glycosyl transferase-like domain-containing protein n=1 Tax=Leptolyngbya foveolarum TaxID=47253 RepID=A0A2W4UCN6_9CYAN|nr:MAG: hypothetical protein DCF25_08870 [Leptolyngbya foveolarum]